MAGYLDSSDDSITQVLDFDYTHFLCEPRQENWTLSSLFTAQFTSLFRDSASTSASYFSNETFTRSVRRSLSLLCSDVVNIETLIKEAKKQRAKQLNIILPYALDELELKMLRQSTKAEIDQVQTDRESLRVRFR